MYRISFEGQGQEWTYANLNSYVGLLIQFACSSVAKIIVAVVFQGMMNKHVICFWKHQENNEDQKRLIHVPL